MRLRVAIGADHGGFELKEEMIRRLGENVTIVDMGAHEFDASDDYPDYVLAVGRAVATGEVDKGIMLCGSGVGACVASNKIRGVRAAVCHDTYSAHQGVEHDDLNVLCLGARVIGIEVATELTVAFLMARFSGEERHLRRLEKVTAIEEAMFAIRRDVDAGQDAADGSEELEPFDISSEEEDLEEDEEDESEQENVEEDGEDESEQEEKEQGQ